MEHIKLFGDFNKINENIVTRSQTIKNILDLQNDIDWDLYSEYNSDFPTNKDYLSSLSNEELDDIVNLLGELKTK